MAAKRRISGKKAIKKDIADSYNEYKFFEGHQYTGMKIGRSHKWYYDKGIWKDKKITPEKWEISFAVNKRRAGHAPEGSGAAVGTQYHWFILAHQNVTKLDANVYSTSMMGLKYKLAHKRADKEKWSVTLPTQRKHLIKFLKEVIDQIKKAPETLETTIQTKSEEKTVKRNKPFRQKVNRPEEELAEV